MPTSLLARAIAFLRRPPWRTVVPVGALVLILLIAHFIWNPGLNITDGRHDLGRNAIWLQHGWLGDDQWFIASSKAARRQSFRDPAALVQLTATLRENHITDIYPHLCPTKADGGIMGVDDAQAERFLNAFQGFRVMPWVGGEHGDDIDPANIRQTSAFTKSIADLLRRHPRFAGVQLDVEPWPNGDTGMLKLLDQVREALPPGKILSVAAYPPPFLGQNVQDIHWGRDYMRQVAERVDQMAFMNYDTGLTDRKLYQYLDSRWTMEELEWTRLPGGRGPEILIGAPAYEDPGVLYHHASVENLDTALPAIHAGLGSALPPPTGYQGVAIYCEWEMTPPKWSVWRAHFLRNAKTASKAPKALSND